MVQLPKINGTYRVGMLSFDAKDKNRKDAIGREQEIRRIPINIYYPTNATEGEAVPYLSEKICMPVSKMYRCKAFADFTMMTECLRNAVPVEGKFPVVFFNHGLNGFVAQNTVLCCDLAAEGYIVVSVSHPQEAVAVEYEDETIEAYEKSITGKVVKPMIGGYIEQMKLLKCQKEAKEVLERFDAFQRKYSSFLMERVIEWEKDVLAVLRTLEEKQTEEGFLLANSMELSKVAAMGHSFGGACALRLLENERFVCAVNMDGAVFGDHNGRDFAKPTLTICCTSNLNLEIGGFYGNSAPSYVASFDNMTHVAFTDTIYFPGSKTTVGKENPIKSRKAVREYHKVFFDTYLKGDGTEEPTFTNYEGITVKRAKE